MALIFSLGALFGAIFGSCLVHFSVILAHFSFLGALWERWGPTFSSQKRFGPPKVRQEAFPRKSGHLFGSILEAFLEYFFSFGVLGLRVWSQGFTICKRAAVLDAKLSTFKIN